MSETPTLVERIEAMTDAEFAQWTPAAYVEQPDPEAKGDQVKGDSSDD